jgi:hypothetical protein
MLKLASRAIALLALLAPFGLWFESGGARLRPVDAAASRLPRIKDYSPAPDCRTTAGTTVTFKVKAAGEDL